MKKFKSIALCMGILISFSALSFPSLAAEYITFTDYSESTITNQFCLEIICCRVCFSFDFLIYPYYPAYTS